MSQERKQAIPDVEDVGDGKVVAYWHGKIYLIVQDDNGRWEVYDARCGEHPLSFENSPAPTPAASLEWLTNNR